MFELALAGVVLMLALVLVIWWRWGCGLPSTDEPWLPAELRRGTVVYAEKTFRASGEVGITGRVDRAYRTGGRRLILLELKTRQVNLTYRSDMIELSAQRVALAAETGEKVAEYGYVVVQDRKGRRYTHRVALLTEWEVRALAMRRAAILEGTVAPDGASFPGLCRHCSFGQSCELRSRRRVRVPRGGRQADGAD